MAAYKNIHINTEHQETVENKENNKVEVTE